MATGSTEAPWWRGAEPGRRLAGKRAFITGGGTTPGGELLGIGEAIAVLFAAQGAKVAVADISAERAAATLELIEQVGGEAIAAVGDLCEESEAKRCVDQAAEAFGGLDTVVNCAAVSPRSGGRPAELDLAEWDRVMTVNLHAVLLTVRAAIPHLQQAGGGSIVNISSIAASRGLGSGAYAASKAAMGGLTRDWAFLHGREGIRVNCILPGHVYTPMGDQGGEKLRKLRHRSALVPTEGVAWDIAWPAVFLASDESRWMTALEIPVDGGTTSITPLGGWMVNLRDPDPDEA
jgi:NAD(P)-dependent dehydrogenase (short-subunit alcohol dehydrogenase family)